MELSYFLAQLFGLMMIIYAVALLMKPLVIQSLIDEVRDNKLFTLIASFIGIVGGLAVVLSHNIWVIDWRVVVTIFGWSALLKGIAYLIAPQSLVSVGGTLYHSPARTKIVLFIMLFLGIYLTGVGFSLF